MPESSAAVITTPTPTSSLLRRSPYSCATFALAVVVLLLAVFWDIDVFQVQVLHVIGIEEREAGEVAIAFLLMLPAIFVDQTLVRQRTYEAAMQAAQLRVVRVTMRTVEDIVNNNLNQLMVLRLEAEGRVSAEAVRLFDEALRDTAAQITSLGDLLVFVERPMATGMGLQASTTKGD